MTDLEIAPSILSADFARLADEIAQVEAAGADLLHVDVMDGQFVPNITLGPVVVSAVRRSTRLPLDVHLMIQDPDRYLNDFASAGADGLTVQYEACTHLQRTLARIRALGKKAGVALNPHTPESALEYLWGDLDLILVMTVNPGFGGQEFLHSQLVKIERVAKRLQQLGAPAILEVDGGINVQTIASARAAGAQRAVAGAAVFSQPDRAAALRALRAACAAS